MPYVEWERYWYPRGTTPLLDRGVFLSAREAFGGEPIDPEVLPLEGYGDIPVLVLLGEPGIGKTDAVEQRARLDPAVHVISLPDEVSLDLIESQVQRALADLDQGASGVEVLFDGLDEAMVRYTNPDKWLGAIFRNIPEDHRRRLRVRLTCRPARWPETLGETLQSLWTPEEVAVLTMAPLTVADVKRAASVVGVDGDAFLREATDRQLLSFAARPVTLMPLLDSFAAGALPDGSESIYRSLTQRLAEHESRGHFDAQLADPPSGPSKHAVAGRIAALSLMCGRPRIVVPGPGTPIGPESLAASEAVRAGSTQDAIDIASVRHCLDSGLFQTSGTDSFRFAHRSYAEFLAADTLDASRLSTGTLLTLVTNPEGQVYPQVAEVAAWLSVLRQEIFDTVVGSQPELLLNSNVASVDDEQRGRIAHALLQRQELTPPPNVSFQALQALHGPAVDRVLLDYVDPASHGRNAVRAALIMAGSSDDPIVLASLVDIAADSNVDLMLREHAASFLPEHLSTDALARLRDAVESDATVSDELRGILLRRLWPAHLSAAEVIALLKTPEQPELVSNYRWFLTRDLPAGFTSADLPLLLDWAAQAAQSGAQVLEDAADGALAAACPFLTDPAVARAAVPLLDRRHHSGILASAAQTGLRQALDSPDVRHALAAAAIDSGLRSDQFAAFLSPFLRPEDFDWLIAQCRAVDDDELKTSWARAANRAFRPLLHPKQTDLLWTAADEASVRSTFSDIFDGVPIDGSQADFLRQQHASEVEFERQREAWKREHSVRPAVIEEAITSGGDGAWFTINVELDREQGIIAEFRIEKLSAWDDLPTEVQQAIVQAAAGRIRLNDPPAYDPRQFTRATFYALRALWLATGDDVQIFEELPADRAAKWAGFLLGVAHIGESEADRSRRCDLLAIAYRADPVQVLGAFQAELDAEAALARQTRSQPKADPAADGPDAPESTASIELLGPVTAFDALEGIWDEELSAALTAWLDAQPDEAGIAEAVPFLARHGQTHADTLAVKVLDETTSGPNEKARKAAAVLALLRLPDPTPYWPTIWTAMTADESVGLAVVGRLQMFGNRLHPGLASGSSDGIVDLYFWLRPRTPPYPLKTGSVPPLAGVAETVLQYLEELGTANAVSALERIAEALPDDEALPYRVASARHRLLEATWCPPETDQLRTLLDEPEKLIATSDASLQQAVVVSLRSAQRRISGPTPAVNDLWDHPSQPKQRTPKPEIELTDWTLRHLQDDLPVLVVNREVEISHGWREGDPGERIDLHIAASVPGTAASALRGTMIVEAKGCWNPGLDTDIEVQLADRYMARFGTAYGIYLVYWFNCKASGSHRYCPSCTHRSVEDLERDLRQAAAALEANGRRIDVVILHCGLSRQPARP